MLSGSSSAPALSGMGVRPKLFELQAAEPSIDGGDDPFASMGRRRLYRRFDLPPKKRVQPVPWKLPPPLPTQGASAALAVSESDSAIHLEAEQHLPPSQIARMVRRHRRREERRKRRADLKAELEVNRDTSALDTAELELLSMKTSDLVAVASSVSKSGSLINVASVAASKIEENERLRAEARSKHSEMTSLVKTKRVRTGKVSPVIIKQELHVMQNIMLREQFVDSLDQLADTVDLQYEQLQRVKRKLTRAKRAEQPLDSHEEAEKLVRKQIEQLQRELSVLIAQLRSVSIEVVEAIELWRKQLRRAETTRSSKEPTRHLFIWEGLNYLRKMASDLQFLDDSAAMRHWLCFRVAGNPMIIPPEDLNVWTIAEQDRKEASKRSTRRKTKRAVEKVKQLRARMSAISMFMDLGQAQRPGGSMSQALPSNVDAEPRTEHADDESPLPDDAASGAADSATVSTNTSLDRNTKRSTTINRRQSQPVSLNQGDEDSDRPLSSDEEDFLQLADAMPHEQLVSALPPTVHSRASDAATVLAQERDSERQAQIQKRAHEQKRAEHRALRAAAPSDPVEALEQVLVRGTGELLNSLRERQEQTGMVRPGLPVPTEEPSAETGASVFLTSAMGPATDGAVTEAGRTSGGASHDLGPRAGLQVNMTRLANQVAAKVKPKECVAVFEASESALADPDVRPSRPKAIQGTLTYPLPDEATIRAREEKLRSDSATKIQTLLRCRLAQFDMDALRTRHAAAETIVRDMQRLFRGARGRSFVDRKLRLKRAEELRLRLNRQREEKAVDSLKAFFRTFVSAARQLRLSKEPRRHAGLFDDQFGEQYKWLHLNPDTLDNAAIVLQCFWRRAAAISQTRQRKHAQYERAARIIQAAARKDTSQSAQPATQTRDRAATGAASSPDDAAVLIQSALRRRHAHLRVEQLVAESVHSERAAILCELSLEAATAAARDAAAEAAVALEAHASAPQPAAAPVRAPPPVRRTPPTSTPSSRQQRRTSGGAPSSSSSARQVLRPTQVDL